MAHRLSRSEKGKWISESKQTRRPPIVIPASDNDALIEANRFTLIGRVTNPSIQKTRALVDFFLQHWSVAGHFTGRDLGPHLFQFTFESERDLQTILRKGPYHFKRWMLLIQRWEPNVSDDFPSRISFWVRIHGIPLHFWNELTLETIGSGIGVVEAKDVDKGRVRVRVNGLIPLERVLDISLPSGEIKKVELEYENLEKHCFLCKALTHEKDDCPQRRSLEEPARVTRDINQSNTLESLDSFRRAKDDKKLERNRSYHQRRDTDFQPRYQRRDDSHDTSRNLRCSSPIQTRRNPPLGRYGDRSDDLQASREGGRDTGLGRISLDKRLARTSPASRRMPQGHTSIQSRLGGKTWVEKSSHSQLSHTPPAVPRCDAVIASQEVNSSLERRPAQERLSLPKSRTLLQIGDDPEPQDDRLSKGQTLTHDVSMHSQERRPVIDRLSLPVARPLLQFGDFAPSAIGQSSLERLPALQRITVPAEERIPLLLNGVANSDSGRLQEVEVQYLEDTFPMHILNSSGGPSSSRLPAKERLSFSQESPIRSLSSDRRHIAMDISANPVIPDSGMITQELQIGTQSKRVSKATSAKATTKRKTTEKPTEKAPPKKKIARSPLQGVSLKKRRLNKIQNSPRSKATGMAPPEDLATGEAAPATANTTRTSTRTRNQQSAAPTINIIPAMTRKGTDFRSDPNTLP